MRRTGLISGRCGSGWSVCCGAILKSWSSQTVSWWRSMPLWDSRIFIADSTYFVACFFMRQNYMPTLPVALILQSVLRRCLAYSLPKTLNDRIFQKILRNTGADGTLPWERGLRIICFIRCLRPCRCCRCLHSAGNISARRQAGGFRCIL